MTANSKPPRKRGGQPSSARANGRRLVAVPDDEDEQAWDEFDDDAAVYPYVDAAGELLFEVVREPDKRFRQRRPDGKGGSVWKLGDVERVAYRLPRVLEAVANGERIHVCEGEKDVGALEEAGEVATCNPGGAGKNLATLDVLRGAAEVWVWQDRDDVGRSHAAKVVARLADHVASIRVVEAAQGKDAADHLAAGYGVEGAVEVKVKAQPEASPYESPDRRLQAVVGALKAQQTDVHQWEARCPGHDDRNPSLSITLGEDGYPKLHCHAGCTEDDGWPGFRTLLLETVGVPSWALGKADEDAVEVELKRLLGELDEADRDHIGRMLTKEQLHALEPPDWLVDGYLPRVGVAVLYGQPGIGKTLELIAISESVARGAAWHGRPTRQGAVVFYEGEGLAEFGPRIRAYEAKHAHDGDEAPMLFDAEGIDLTSLPSLAATVRTVRRLAKDSPYPVRLLVVEPLIENMSGDENAEGMDAASRGLRALARALDLCVLVGHHTNASGERARGNDKLRARVHSMFRMEPLGTASNARAIVAEKQRNGPLLALEVLMVEAAGSVVFQHVREVSSDEFVSQRDERREQAQQMKRAARKEADRSKARELLSAAITDNPGASQKKVVSACKSKGIGTGALEDELEAMRQDGAVRVETGPGTMKRHFPTVRERAAMTVARRTQMPDPPDPGSTPGRGRRPRRRTSNLS
ncbi:AAA family ATPase [Egicoccus halophilus]|uniref:Toprim domain-containing protein n=1 Tax=Egicoccus halophilus TaxID=1670830 RepID=A0A8J3AAF7_9ACTN|nr:AAA family ATPase [Egicoccus halophilus]GGI09030.1 hypothetical protein GCM10011354_32040 [Egicoccus halophilus]